MKKFVYTLIQEEQGKTCIHRKDENGIEVWIPNDPTNSDYQAYLRWLNGEDEQSGTL